MVVLVLAQFAFLGLVRAQVSDTLPPQAASLSTGVDVVPLDPTVRPNIEALIASVNALVTTGKLKSAQGRVLTGTLELALRSLDQGKTEAAVLLLKGFIVEVKLLVKLKRLSNADGQALIDAAEAIVSQLVDPLPPCPACIFGPQVYKRLIVPTTDTRVFGADPTADYVIDIDDLGSEGADGSVVLNDEVLLAPRKATEKGPRHVRRGVTLRDQNTLVVKLAGKLGSKLMIQVLGGTKSVGVGGGSIKAPGGGARLEIPPLALPQDTEISISSAPGATAPNVLDGVTPLGPAWSLEPHGLVFDQPVTMSINYSSVLSQVSSPDEIGVVHWNDSGTFVDVVSAVDDPSAQELTFSLGDFSRVGIIRGASGYNTYRMHWNLTPFSVDPLFEEALWAAPTRDLNYTTADGGRISVLQRPASFVCPPDEPFYWPDQTGKTCMPTPGLNTERVLDRNSHVTIVIFDNQTTRPGEASTALMHQLGHALGMAHPWRLPLASWTANPELFPVMSSLWWGGLPTGPKLVRDDLHPLDIAAIQSKYGVGVSLPPLRVPTLQTPPAGAQIPQNDPSTGCSLLPNDPRRGYGFKIAFDWANVPEATQYRLVAKQQSALNPLVDIVVSQSEYTSLNCNSIVVGGNLTGWSWQVQALSDGRVGAFSSPRPFEFLPCLLPDGTACGTTPPPGPGPAPDLVTLFFSGTLGGSFPANYTGFFVFDTNTPDATPGLNYGNYQGAVKLMSISLGSTTFVSTNPTSTRIDVVNDVDNPGLGVKDFYTAEVVGGFSGTVNGLSLDQFSIVFRGSPVWFSSDSLVRDPSLAATGIEFARANFFLSDGQVHFGTSTVPTATAPDGSSQVLIDTGPGSTDPAGGAGLFARGGAACSPPCESFQFLAGQFTLSSGAILDSVEGWMTGTFAGSLEVKIYTDNIGVPGNIIFSQTYTPGSQPFGWVLFPNYNAVLAAGTYWLSFEPVADSQFSSGMPPGAPTPLQNYAFFADGNNRWVNFGQFGPQPGFGIRISAAPGGYTQLIDFETLPGGQSASPTGLTDQFSSLGVEFSGGAQLFDASVYYGAGPNFAVWNQLSPYTYGMTLAANPQDITFELTGNNAFPFALAASDATGGAIPSTSILRQSQVYAQPVTGTLFRRETIRILSSNGVRTIDFNSATCGCGLILDNVRF